MSFLATLEWDVRTTGDDANGGGFDPTAGVPGTDYSQQNSAQVTYTDLVIDGTTNTHVTSAGNPFTSAHVGNVINITSGTGFTVQRVQIISVSGSTATVDKSLGTLSSTGGNGKLGGALATFSKGITVNSASTAAGTTVHLKAGTYTLTSAVVLDSNYTGIDFKVIGFGSTHRDGGTRPLVTTATNSTKIFACYNASYRFENINFSNTAGTRADCIYSASSNPYLQALNCTFDGFAVALNGDNAVGSPMSAWLRNVEIKNCTSDGIRMYYWLHAVGCWIHANGRDGIRAFGDLAQCVSFSVISGNTGIGINQAVTPSRFGCRVVNCSITGNGSDGIQCTLPVWINAENNIIYNNGGYGIQSNGAGTDLNRMNPVTSDYNAFGLNTSGARNNFTAGPHDVSLSAGPFTASGSGDFSLNATAGGGAACKQAAFPGSALFGTGALDIGAVQTSGGIGGGGGSLSANPLGGFVG